MSIFGNYEYSNKKDFKKTNFFKLKDGESVFRILPPIGGTEKWSVYHAVHFGYKDSTGKIRPFASSAKADETDAALQKIVVLRDELKKAMDSKNTDLVNQLKKDLMQYNVDKNHYMNVIDLQGNIGILKIRNKAKQALNSLLEDLAKEGVHPLNPEDGRYIVFKRMGTGLDTTFSVHLYMKKLGAGKYEDVKHVVTPELMDRIYKDGSFVETRDLTTLFKYPNQSEIYRIVTEGPTAVDDILIKKPTSTKSTTATNTVGTGLNSVVKAVETATPPQPTSTAQTITEMSDEEFFQSIETL